MIDYVNSATQKRLPPRAELQVALNLIPAHTWYAVPSGALTFLNERGADYVGLPKDHPLRFGIDTGAEWDSHIPFLHPDDHEETRRVWSTCLRTGCAGQVSFRGRNAEGGYRWFLSCAEPVRASDGTLLYWIGVNLDIEERKQAEFYLAEGQRLAHMGSWAFNAAGFDHWSPEMFRIHGLDPSGNAPTVEQYLALVHLEDREFVAQAIQKMLADNRGFDFTKRIVRPDGEIRHVRCVGTAATQGGTFGGFLGTGMDVTEQEELTKALRKSEEELRQVLDLAPQFIAVFGRHRERLFMNSSGLDYFGLTLDEWRDNPPVCAVGHPDDAERVHAQWDRAMSSGSAFESEVRFRKGDGSYRWFLARYNPLRDEHEQITRWYVAGTDIEDRKRAEDKIREQEAELRQVLDLAPQLIGVLGPRRERLYANRMALTYYGISLDEWRQRSFGPEVHPDDFDMVKAHVDRSVSSPTAFELEMRLRNGHGAYRWFLVRYNPLHDGQGQLVRWYIACTDIEDRKRAEERLQRENAALREEIDETSMYEEIVGTSPALQTVLLSVSKVAPTDSTVLITGETGTGKELVARAIHRRSDRRSSAFISVNCAAIPRDLIPSELFGHEKGAFTGATQRRLGRFELADGGTIFLDEVGELSPDTQVALLRVLQEREFERVGGRQPIHVDVRVIAATNRDLKAAVANGTFRQDLFYRLNVFPIEAPPLRERKDDLPMLVEYFVQRYAKRAGKYIRLIDKKALALLQSYDWPGNIRELQNIIERSVILSSGDVFSIDESWLSKETFPPASWVEASAHFKSDVAPRSEREIIEAALTETRGRVSGPTGAAVKLGISPSTLEHRIKALKINKRQFKYR